ncbi:single-stranded-DNA-specific exonuclease RecJ [Patescibacteria group bacterium]|nr:single-stranded-DNA-specific exonuclease RecJ [Patescibacteria group bacterium]
MATKQWKLKDQIFDDFERQLLFSKNIKEEDARDFFNPDYENSLHDPFKILDMDKAVERILSAIDKNEKVILFGDYDADGICGTVVFHDFFKKIGFSNFDVYIPDRHKEEYGLSIKAIDEFAKRGVNLIITIDCGITDFKEVEKAGEKGIDTIITDHHLEVRQLPKAVAIVDPKRNKDIYPYKMLCGAAVAFKTVEAILQKRNFNVTKGWSKWLLDLVCIATVADMVPLLDENRTLVYYGLQVLRKTQRPGFLSLFKKLQLKKENISEDDIAFLIAPRINVASRMEHANVSFNLLITENSEEADWIADRLDQKNIERKEMANRIAEEIDMEIKNSPHCPELLFFGNSEWPAGILGVVACRLVEKYSLPVFLWAGGADKGVVKGSARSDGIINLVELIKEADKLAPSGESLFLDYGGHVFSAGFNMKESNLEILKKGLLAAYEKTKKEETENILWIDKEAGLDDVDWEFLKTVERFSPFGMDNPKPIFLFKNLEIFKVKMFGNGGIHLGLDFKKLNGFISAIGFFMPSTKFDVKKGDRIDLVASVERSNFKGYDELRLRIVDLMVR